jgi:Domain of unknown function (DUF4159)/Aerotolerance regulator N-terminal
MLTLGPLGFLAPWMLAGLVVLPVVWWLLRILPPAPSQVAFPPLRLLLGLIAKEETPAHTPWWLLLLRCLIAALVILALAQPLFNPRQRLREPGPLLLVIDDTWAAAPQWPQRVAAMHELVAQAEHGGRPVQIVTTAPPPDGGPVDIGKLMPAAEAKALLGALQPKPWGADRKPVVAALATLKFDTSADVAWLADGVDDGFAYTLAERLQWFGGLQVIAPPDDAATPALTPPSAVGDELKLAVLRARPSAAPPLFVRAIGERGQALAREPVSFPAGATTGTAAMNLPTELRNRITRLEIEDQASAAAVVLVDERWRRRPVGLVSGQSLEGRQPLLSGVYYLERALTPFTEVRTGAIADLLKRELAVLMLADVGQVVGADRVALKQWLEQGGVLVRFAGPKLGENSDEFLPVTIRPGSRQLGGAMSWAQPAMLAPFPEASPFTGLAVAGDVTVGQQVLAEPDLALAQKTWARLADGTPLVTGAARGRGWVVLFHTTANTDWSNLALSGMFVEMLRRIVELSQGVAGGDGAEVLAPYALLDGFGRLTTPQGAATGLGARDFAATKPGPRHPPGLYGNDVAQRALNLTAGWTEIAPIKGWPNGVQRVPMGERREFALLPALLTAAVALALADLLIAFAMRGLLDRRQFGYARVLALVALLLVSGAAVAQDANRQPPRRPPQADDFALKASLDLRLAYVLTGNPEVDDLSHAGLAGLTNALFQRTSVEASDPIGVNLERDEIVFFPFLYWPVTAEQRDLSDKALAKIDGFMKTGGLIVMDTRDQDLSGIAPGAILGRAGPSANNLRKLLARLDVPPLIPVPPEHVLTKAFYLMQEFPGRYAGGQVWVERHRNAAGGNANDGVSALVIGGNDWAGAWAIDADHRPIVAVTPGGARQREHAYRFGINLVMYALTGNYKADLVHVPALLERLGQ